MTDRKYLPTLSELVDRLSIAQLKEVFIVEHKAEYADEISDILHDIQLLAENEDLKFSADVVRAIVVLSQMNLHIWHNETNYRKGIGEGNETQQKTKSRKKWADVKTTKSIVLQQTSKTGKSAGGNNEKSTYYRWSRIHWQFVDSMVPA